MLARLITPAPDPLWGLMAACRADPRPDKLELIVGVYRDDEGRTPVLDCVRAAEAELAAEGASKAYRPPMGDAAFTEAMARLILGDPPSRLSRQTTIQTVGGTGALRLLADFIALAAPRATVWLTTPGYVHHRPLMRVAGLEVASWRWRERQGRLDLDLALDDLALARKGDVVLLHGACHNPTGVDPTARQWTEIARLCDRKGLIPLVDMAYQGFGKGLEQDAQGVRTLVDLLDTVLIAASCSKNMGLYCERVGAAAVVGRDGAGLEAAAGVLAQIAGQSCFMAPQHGAAVAARLLGRRDAWEAELAEMRGLVRAKRRSLANALGRAGAPEVFQALRSHKGLFSRLPLSEAAMERLRVEHGVYGAADGRINIAGVAPAQMERLAYAVAAVSVST